MLVEQVDRLSRLSDADWKRLRSELDARQIRVVALDLPTSWMMATQSDEFTARMFGAVNAMMLDVLAAVARKDYEDRRRRVAQGQAKAKAEGRYRGRPEDTAKNARIARMLNAGLSWSQIQDTLHCSRGTVAKVALRMRQEEAAAWSRHELIRCQSLLLRLLLHWPVSLLSALHGPKHEAECDRSLSACTIYFGPLSTEPITS